MTIEVICCWLTSHVGVANEISAVHRNAARFYLAYSMTGAVEARQTAVFVSGTFIDTG